MLSLQLISNWNLFSFCVPGGHFALRNCHNKCFDIRWRYLPFIRKRLPSVQISYRKAIVRLKPQPSQHVRIFPRVDSDKSQIVLV